MRLEALGGLLFQAFYKPLNKFKGFMLVFIQHSALDLHKFFLGNIQDHAILLVFRNDGIPRVAVKIAVI